MAAKCLFDCWYYDGLSQGRFFTDLFNAFIHGDSNNRIRIVTAFPEQFQDSEFVREWITGENIAWDRIKMSIPKTGELNTNIGPISMDLTVAMCVIAQLQLATRHPKNGGSSRQIAECFARSLQQIVIRVAPESAELIEKGWNRNYDVEC